MMSSESDKFKDMRSKTLYPDGEHLLENSYKNAQYSKEPDSVHWDVQPQQNQEARTSCPEERYLPKKQL